jgi:hypothetical protein
MKIYTAKRHPITCPEGTEEEQRYSYTPSWTSALDRMGGKRHAPAALPPEMKQYTPYRELGGPQGRNGRVRKISPPLGFDSRTPPARSELKNCNSKTQLSGDSVTPRIEQKLRTNNVHFNFSRLRRWDSPLTKIKQSVADSRRMAAALHRTTQKYTSERADQRISVHFRIMTTILAKTSTEGFLLPATGILGCTGTYGPVQAPTEKTQNYSVQTLPHSVLLHDCEPYTTSKTEETRNFWKNDFKTDMVRWRRQESGECGTIVNYTTPLQN